MTQPNWPPALTRPRAMRDQGQRRLTPGYLTDLSDTKITLVDITTSTARQTLLTPTTRTKIRIVRITVYQLTTDGAEKLYLYFGTGAAANTNPAKIISLLEIPDLSSDATRTWTRGEGPVGLRDEVVSAIWVGTPSTTHKAIAEYTEER